MHRKCIAIILIVCLCACLVVPHAGAASSVCFIALNDDLLELGSSAYTSYSTTYVPYSVFASMGVYCSYFSESSILLMYDAKQQIYFEVDTGNTYDGSENIYSVSAIMRNGQVYVPASFICGKFGLTYSYIPGTGCGDIVRITNGGAVLDDSNFLRAASSLMQARYNAYTGNSDGTSAPGPSPTTPTEVEETENPHSGSPAYIRFTGLPDPTLLKTLQRYSACACFFMTAEQIGKDPDMIRRIAGEGHGIGLMFDPQDADEDGGLERAAELLFEAAQIKTLLASAAPEDYDAGSLAAEKLGLLWCGGGIDAEGKTAAELIAVLENSESVRTDLTLTCSESAQNMLVRILNYFVTEQYSFRVLRETNVLENDEQ